MSASKNEDNSSVGKWQEIVKKLSSTTDTRLGLMSVSMPQALHSSAWSETDRLVADAQPVDSVGAAWDDWWEKREQLADGSTTVQKIARNSLDRLERIQVATNACVELLHDSAMKKARRLDEHLASGKKLGLLGGMPLAHKDLLHRQRHDVGHGMAGTLGAASADAAVLQLFEKADALNLARLQMTELAFDPSGVNAMAGHCRNPWSTEYIPGGSSSGSAIVVAAGAVDGAIGSDTGGSIRIPSVLCGVTGLKPTFGLVSRTGAMSLSFTNDHLGPIARSARDCALMLQAIAGHDIADANSVPAPYPGRYTDNLDAPVHGLRIGLPSSYFSSDLNPDVQAMMHRSIESFRQLGVEIREVPDFPYDELNALAILVIRAEAAAMFHSLLQPEAIKVGSFTHSRLQEGVPIPAELYLRALALRGPLLLQFAQTVMADVDALVLPVFSPATPRITEFDEINPRSQFLRSELTRLTRPINYLGLPSLALPGGVCVTADTREHLPTGFQLVGRPYSEPLLLRMGHAFQKATDWHLRRPPL